MFRMRINSHIFLFCHGTISGLHYSKTLCEYSGFNFSTLALLYPGSGFFHHPEPGGGGGVLGVGGKEETTSLDSTEILRSNPPFRLSGLATSG